MHAVIRRSLNQALQWGYIYQNPTSRVTAPSPEKKPPATLTVEQANHFLESTKDHRLFPVFVLAITSGMRMGEILGLHWPDIRLDEGNLSVNHTIQLYRGKPVLGEPKTSSSRRTIALSELAVSALEQIEGREGLVFQTRNGTPINPRNLYRDFQKELKKAGLPRIRFHDLRHTFATLMLTVDGGVHPKIVQEMLGHSSISLTLDTYSHILPDIQRDATEKIDDIFSVA
jgi:integrase